MAAAAGLAAFVLLALAAAATVAIRATEPWPAGRAALAAAPKPVVAIVLGMGPTPAEPILDRAELAAELYRDGLVSVLVASGGQGADEAEPEAATIARALTARGVPEAVVLREARSATTRENLELSLAAVEAAGIAPGRIVLVTHAYHAARAAAVARRFGVDALVAATEGPRLDRRAYRFAREVLATIRFWLS